MDPWQENRQGSIGCNNVRYIVKPGWVKKGSLLGGGGGETMRTPPKKVIKKNNKHFISIICAYLCILVKLFFRREKISIQKDDLKRKDQLLLARGRLFHLPLTVPGRRCLWGSARATRLGSTSGGTSGET